MYMDMCVHGPLEVSAAAIATSNTCFAMCLRIRDVRYSVSSSDCYIKYVSRDVFTCTLYVTSVTVSAAVIATRITCFAMCLRVRDVRYSVSSSDCYTKYVFREVFTCT